MGMDPSYYMNEPAEFIVYRHREVSWKYYFVVDYKAKKTYLVQHTPDFISSELQTSYRGEVQDVSVAHPIAQYRWFEDCENSGLWIPIQNIFTRLWCRWRIFLFERDRKG